MKLKFIDFETFPEWNCCSVSDQEESYLSSPHNFKFTPEEELNIKKKMRTYTTDTPAEIAEIKKEFELLYGFTPDIRSYINPTEYLADMSKGCLSGWNIKAFDLQILNGKSMHFTPRQTYIQGNIIVDKNLANRDTEHMKISNYCKPWMRWKGAEAFQDLMDDSDKKSLKAQEGKLGMDIRETTVPFGKSNLTAMEKAEIIYYCIHDVYACHVYYQCVAKPYIDTKLALCKTYGLTEKEGYENTNANLSAMVLLAKKTHGTEIKDPTIVIRQTELRKYLEKWVPAETLQHMLTSQKPIMRVLFENKVYMADGGLHSILTLPKVGRVQSVLYMEACDEWGIYNVDASSCYPSVMLFCDAFSRACGEEGRKRFEEIFRKRIELKMKPKKEWTSAEKDFVAAAKLVLNTTYGAMGNEYIKLYDDYMRSKVCRIGQLILVALANCFYQSIKGLKVIQTNTDGIMVYCRRTDLPKLQELVKEFEDLSHFIFEIEEDSKVWQNNVNNYIALDKNGMLREQVDIEDDLKSKGKKYLSNIWQPGTNRIRPLGIHVIAKAQIEFYVNKKNPIKYILEHNNVNDFVLTTTKGPTYYALIQKTRDGDIDLGKVSRVVATTTEKYGQVRKQKMVDGKMQEDTCALSPDHTWIMNDALYNYKFEGVMAERELVHIPTGMRAKVDWGYYAERMDDVLDIPWYKLKKGQLTFTHEFNLQEV